MSVDPQSIRAERHPEIADLLGRHINVVLDRWSRRAVEEQPNAARVHHSVLLDHLYDFLRMLCQSLAESDDPHTKQHWVTALDHGEQRWEAGWSLPEVIRDYQILRLVILDFLDETLDRPLGYREILAIGLALDEAIGASVVSYVNERDEALGEAEKERAVESEQVQQRLEEQSLALREADRRKDEFLAMLSHELRNPLAPIRNAAHILTLKAPLDGDVLWVRDVIERQVQQMNRMVDDLLDVSRITQGKFKLEKEPVEMGTIVAGAVESCRPIVDTRKHRLHVDCCPEPLWMTGDRHRLIQVVANLLNNAAKYTEVGGEIWLTTQKSADEVVVKVRDTGIGIPSALLPRVFDPFLQEDRLPDRAHGGLGIGLALVRSLVDLHGGRVQAFSAGRGQGSEFVLHLPILPQVPPVTVSGPQYSSSTKAARRRILVVDDAADSAETLAKLLSVAGHEVYTAHDGPQALEAARLYVPEVVMLDIGMPRMDGFEVARRMRQDPRLKDVLLVAMTGYGQDTDRRRSQAAGFSAHLVKPVDLNVLRAAIERLPEIAQDERGREK